MIFGIRYFELAAFIFIALLFIFYPELDIYFSSLFYQDEYFYLKKSVFARFFYKNVDHVSRFLLLFMIVGTILSHYREKVLSFAKTDFYYIGTTILVGPLIIINLILKNLVGRSRPKHIESFGGEAEFFNPFDFTADFCSSNCSFTCGHCGAAFIFIAFAFLFTGLKRKIVFALAITWGSLASLGRIMQGAHFLSDAVFAFFIILFTAKIAHYFFYIHPRKPQSA